MVAPTRMLLHTYNLHGHHDYHHHRHHHHHDQEHDHHHSSPSTTSHALKTASVQCILNWPSGRWNAWLSEWLMVLRALCGQRTFGTTDGSWKTMPSRQSLFWRMVMWRWSVPPVWMSQTMVVRQSWSPTHGHQSLKISLCLHSCLIKRRRRQAKEQYIDWGNSINFIFMRSQKLPPPMNKMLLGEKTSTISPWGVKICHPLRTICCLEKKNINYIFIRDQNSPPPLNNMLFGVITSTLSPRGIKIRYALWTMCWLG